MLHKLIHMSTDQRLSYPSSHLDPRMIPLTMMMMLLLLRRKKFYLFFVFCLYKECLLGYGLFGHLDSNELIFDYFECLTFSFCAVLKFDC